MATVRTTQNTKRSKSILRRTQRQIWTIEAQLKNITIIEPGRNAAGTVRLGSVVMLQPEDENTKDLRNRRAF